MSRQHFYSRYNPPPSSGLACAPGSSLTKQEFKAECDINALMARYKMGQLDDISARSTAVSGTAMKREPLFGDFSQVPDFQAAQNLLIHAREQFMAMPSSVRDRFGNNPETFLRFAGGKNVADTFEELGLLTPEATNRRKKERAERAAAERSKIESDAVAKFVAERDKK